MVVGDTVARREPPLFLPLLASIVACALLSGLWLMSLGGPNEGFLLGLSCGGAVGAVHVLLLGVPYAFWLRRRGRFDAWRMALGGLAIGGLHVGIIFGPLVGAATGVIGALSALAFLAVFRGLHPRD